jgi:hypothetical protein
MNRAAKIAQKDASPAWVPRIRELIEKDQIGAARRLLEEALQEGAVEPELATLREVLAPARLKTSPVRDFDRSAEFRWFAEHASAYRGQWVAVLGDDLLAHATTLDELLAELKKRPPAAPALLHHID